MLFHLENNSLKRLYRPTLAKTWWFLLDQLYPPRCGGCDKRGTLYCSACRTTLAIPGKDADSVNGIEAVLSAGVFDGPLRKAVHNLKYNGDTRLAIPLAGLL